MNDDKSNHCGKIVSVRGSVVDVRFEAHLPPVYSVLRTGAKKEIVIEVLAQRDANHVRGIALTPTQGLARGMAVENTGGPLKAPVGKGILSRMFDVFGNAIDREPAPSMSNGVRCIGNHRPWRDVPPSRKFLKPVSRLSMCSCLWSAEEKRDCLAARAWARPFCSPR